MLSEAVVGVLAFIVSVLALVIAIAVMGRLRKRIRVLEKVNDELYWRTEHAETAIGVAERELSRAREITAQLGVTHTVPPPVHNLTTATISWPSRPEPLPDRKLKEKQTPKVRRIRFRK